MSLVQKAASKEQKEEQERRFAEQADKASVERGAQLTEHLLKFSVAYCKEQGLSPEECVFASGLFLVNLRETFPAGKPAFDEITARARAYYDEHA